jgi:hypothetical protein
MTSANQVGHGVIGLAKVNDAGDIEIYAFGGGAGAPARAEGVLDIVSADLLSVG